MADDGLVPPTEFTRWESRCWLFSPVFPRGGSALQTLRSRTFSVWSANNFPTFSQDVFPTSSPLEFTAFYSVKAVNLLWRISAMERKKSTFSNAGWANWLWKFTFFCPFRIFPPLVCWQSPTRRVPSSLPQTILFIFRILVQCACKCRTLLSYVMLLLFFLDLEKRVCWSIAGRDDEVQMVAWAMSFR